MDNLAFVFATGEGKYAEQGVFLARSITQTNPDAELYVFVPEAESPDRLSELEQYGTILEGAQRIPEYGISTKIDALAAAEAVADEEYLLLLDTDMLVFDEITVHNYQTGNLFLKPVDVGLQYWGRRNKSLDEWTSLAGTLSLPVPEWRYESTFDRKPIPPYWNAGFVLTANNGFGARWLDAVERIHPDLSFGWHADQVTLGLLSQEYEVVPLDNRYNYPLHLRLRTPDDVKVLHYHNRQNLKKAKRYASLLKEIGIWEQVVQDKYSYPRGAWRYLKRKYLPMNEEHLLERVWNRVLG
jgi:hypothetical protein